MECKHGGLMQDCALCDFERERLFSANAVLCDVFEDVYKKQLVVNVPQADSVQHVDFKG